MTTALTAALAQLNQATERDYAVVEREGAYVLTIPTGGSYPPVVDANDMVRRLLTLTHAAVGREAVKPLPK